MELLQIPVLVYSKYESLFKNLTKDSTLLRKPMKKFSSAKLFCIFSKSIYEIAEDKQRPAAVVMCKCTVFVTEQSRKIKWNNF